MINVCLYYVIFCNLVVFIIEIKVYRKCLFEDNG